jgi:predicted AAA+ superfamily ATPase
MENTKIYMYRHLISSLLDWKMSKSRKPLIIQGARQVGKTWLMKEFGRQAFENVVYLNFENNERLKDIFNQDFDISRILAIIEIESGQTIRAENTLLIFDEIQEANKGLTALKYFYELAPHYYIVAAGSLLGISMQKNNSFPVGKIDFLKLYPMSFIEFLENTNEAKLAQQIIEKNWNILLSFHQKLTEILRLYYFVGGMPEAVKEYIETKNLDSVRDKQNKILIGYENDFAKHAPFEIVPKIRLVWSSIISQLAKENRKFVYGQLRKGSRAKDFETAISWLVDAGLLLKINRIEKPVLPLKAYLDFDAFKLYLVDIGLLNAMADLDKKILLERNTILSEFKGALTEQYVCQQLMLSKNIYYWTANNATAEIDFMYQEANAIVPIEVKAEENLKSKSLKVFVEKYENTNAIRLSMSPYRQESWLTNVPLYAVEALKIGL